jgi:hypothetical protein
MDYWSNWLPPYYIDHKRIEFVIGWLVILGLAYWFGRPGPPRHRG